MGLLKFFIMVLLPIRLKYGVQGVSFDYADPQDFKNPLLQRDDVMKLFEKVIGKDVAELCAHGKKYTIDCNTCICDERTGVTRCARKKCPEGTFSNCIHGTHFMKDCNRCSCSMKTGKTTCTLEKCPINENKLAGKCPRGKYYSPDNGCNKCFCDLLSGGTICTLVYCDTIKEDELKNKDKEAGMCPHGIRFGQYNDWCKNCNCDPKTGITRCSQIFCFKGDEAKNVMPSTLLAKNKNLKLKIKEAATGCTPPEAILIGSCRCDCRLPSVVVCRKSCFLDPVG